MEWLCVCVSVWRRPQHIACIMHTYLKTIMVWCCCCCCFCWDSHFPYFFFLFLFRCRRFFNIVFCTFLLFPIFCSCVNAFVLKNIILFIFRVFFFMPHIILRHFHSYVTVIIAIPDISSSPSHIFLWNRLFCMAFVSELPAISISKCENYAKQSILLIYLHENDLEPKQMIYKWYH